MTIVPSLSLIVDLDPLKVKSNHNLEPAIYPTIDINKPRYPIHILIY